MEDERIYGSGEKGAHISSTFNRKIRSRNSSDSLRVQLIPVFLLAGGKKHVTSIWGLLKFFKYKCVNFTLYSCVNFSYD